MAPYKFNFVPERQLDEVTDGSGSFYITLNKMNMLLFKADYTDAYEIDGKFLRFFADREKMAIGWSIIDGSTNLNDLNDARQCVKKEGNPIVFGIGKLLKKINYEVTGTIKDLPIKIFKSPLMANDVHYFLLPPKEVVVSLNGEKVTSKKED